MNRNVAFESGPWTGYFLQVHLPAPGWMQMILDCDSAGRIRGEGIDCVGPWTLHGHYQQETGRCQWTKQYVGRHQVRYDGEYGEQGISGTWEIAPHLTNRFHIWPERMGHLTEAHLLALQPAGDPSGALRSVEPGFPFGRPQPSAWRNGMGVGN